MKIKIQRFLFAIILFLTLSPYFTWSISSYLNPILGVIIGIVFYNHRRRQSIGDDDSRSILFFLAIIIFFIITGGANLFGIIVSVSLLFIPFCEEKFSSEIYRYFTTIYSIVIVIALISEILLLFNMNSPISIIRPLNENDFDYYTIYPLFLAVSNNNGLYGALRFAGPFDEPGVIGSISAILLCINKFNLKDWKTYVYLLSGFASLSFFFFIAVFTYGFFYFIFIKKKIIPFLFFVGLFAGFYWVSKDDPLLSHTLWGRFEWSSSDSSLAGDNRMSEDADIYYKSKIGTFEYWFGLRDYDSYWKIARGGSSYKNIVMKNGMLWLVLYILFFISIAWRNKKSTILFVLFAALFLEMMYQRPYVVQPFWVFLFSFFARYNLTNNNKTLENV